MSFEKLISLQFSSQGVRPAQEDFMLADSERGIFACADGFGGQEYGSRASELACRSIKDFLVNQLGDRDATLPFEYRKYFTLGENVLFNALSFANYKVFKENAGKGLNHSGGASVAAGFLSGDRLSVGVVGTCEVLVLRDGRIRRILGGSNYAQLWEPFESHEFLSMQFPLQSLGTYEDVQAEMREFRIQRGDWVLLKTDGVSDGLAASIAEIQLDRLSSTKIIDMCRSLSDSWDFLDNAAYSLAIFE